MSQRFTDKVVLITGAGTGIGKAAALAFAREGAKLVLGVHRIDDGDAVVRAIDEAVGRPGRATFLPCDVREEADVEALVNHAVRTFGRLDVAFNNAGVEGTLGPITDETDANYRLVMDTNVKGVLMCMKHEIRAMSAAPSGRGGAIVNTSSIDGSIGWSQSPVYIASKHAIEGLTKAAALECATSGVRINAVAPGSVDTKMIDRFLHHFGDTREDFGKLHPMGRIATADEVAQAVLFLASDAASFTTGTTLMVDGGYTAQ